ncbi:MAG: S1C family serine protease [Pseudomonadota bacterium]
MLKSNGCPRGAAIRNLFPAFVLLAVLAFPAEAVEATETTPTLFQTHQPALFQIKVIDVPSGNRSALGTGFAIDANLVATNYHVISQFLENPGNIDIHLVDENNEEHPVTVVAIDVIDDLALLYSEKDLSAQLQLADRSPNIGATIYALGNPYDLGMSVTEGIYNGVKEESFPRRVHYSGPVNSGMSGGPTVNSQGEVVGINVATAGNSVGFLVPVDSLQRLWASAELEALDDSQMIARIGEQLWATQNDLMGKLLQAPWPEESFGGALVPGKGAEFMSCWGGTSEEDDTGIDSIQRGCNSGQQVRIKRGFSSTYIEYEFAHMSSDKLGSFRLYNQASSAFAMSWPANRVREDDASNYHCVEDHILSDASTGVPTRFKAIYCSRAYREVEGLFDAFYVGMTTDKSDEILFTHFTLSGFSEENIKRFLTRFLESIQWQSS